MPRDLPLGNGSMQINFDPRYNLRDIFWPHVGKENHTAGNINHTGVWVSDDGSGQPAFAWFEDAEWQRDLRYRDETMVTAVTMQNDRLGLHLLCEDTVDFDRDTFIRHFVVHNLRDIQRSVRFFFHYDWYIYGEAVGDTTYYQPTHGSRPGEFLVAYKSNRYFVLNAQVGRKVGISSWANGVKGVGGLLGTWKDAEDGQLACGNIAQGSVDCTLGVHLDNVPAGGTVTFYHWLCAGYSFQDVEREDRRVRERGPASFLERTANYWHRWANKLPMDWADLPADLITAYKRSLLVLRTQVDDHGAVIASTDYDILTFARDSYCYMWPRDAALVIYALDEAGFQDPARGLFTLIARIMRPEGYLLHKYDPEGALGSSWHPWADSKGNPQLPIQEDETALIIYAMWHHYEKYHDFEFVSQFYSRVIKAAGDFMVSYRHLATRLPGPSHDLWEERRGISSFTVGAVWAGLTAAANFAEMFGDLNLADEYRTAAREIKNACVRFMFDQEGGYFVRQLAVHDDDTTSQDCTVDASATGLFQFGMFAADDPLIVSTMQAIKEKLVIPTPVGGVARYQSDYYQRVSQDVTGNPWFICTLWLADYYIAAARNLAEMEPALDLLHWVCQHSLPSGVLAEQIHPYTGAPLSVSPLTWSHAAYVTTTLRYVQKRQTFFLQAKIGSSDLKIKQLTPAGPVIGMGESDR